jgi:hypothetical protein
MWQFIKARTTRPLMITMSFGKTAEMEPIHNMWEDAYYALARPNTCGSSATRCQPTTSRFGPSCGQALPWSAECVRYGQESGDPESGDPGSHTRSRAGSENGSLRLSSVYPVVS